MPPLKIQKAVPERDSSQTLGGPSTKAVHNVPKIAVTPPLKFTSVSPFTHSASPPIGSDSKSEKCKSRPREGSRIFKEKGNIKEKEMSKDRSKEQMQHQQTQHAAKKKHLYDSLDSSDAFQPDTTEFFNVEHHPMICGVSADPDTQETDWDDDFDITQDGKQGKKK